MLLGSSKKGVNGFGNELAAPLNVHGRRSHQVVCLPPNFILKMSLILLIVKVCLCFNATLEWKFSKRRGGANNEYLLIEIF